MLTVVQGSRVQFSYTLQVPTGVTGEVRVAQGAPAGITISTALARY